MLSWWIERKLREFEQNYDYDASYVRTLRNAGWGAVVDFQRSTSALGKQAELPTDVWHVTRVVATQFADCGPCLQLVVTMAERALVPTPVLRACLLADYDRLPEPLGLVARYTRACLERTPEADALRERVQQRLGEAGVVRLALVMTTCLMYPTLKFALGHGQSCSKTRLGEQWILAKQI